MAPYCPAHDVMRIGGAAHCERPSHDVGGASTLRVLGR